MRAKSNVALHCDHYGIHPLPRWWVHEGDFTKVSQDMHSTAGQHSFRRFMEHTQKMGQHYLVEHLPSLT
jgi:hypothetical protein